MPPFEAGLQIKVKNYRYEGCVCRPTLQWSTGAGRIYVRLPGKRDANTDLGWTR